MENKNADIQAPKGEFLKVIEEKLLNEIETSDKIIDFLVSMIQDLVKADSDEMKDGAISYQELKNAFIEAKIPKDKYEEYAQILGIKAPMTFSLVRDVDDIWLSEPSSDKIEVPSSNDTSLTWTKPGNI
jgi:hypothetical protein